MDRELAIIGQIYDATLGEEDWSNPLVELADYCGMENAALLIIDPKLAYASVIAPRADPEVISAYNEHWWEHDPTVPATQSTPVGQLTSLAYTGRDRFLRSAFHNEFWSRSGLSAERLHTNLALSDGVVACCVLHASERRDEVYEEQFQRFSIFTPHLIRAVAIQRKLRLLEMEKALLAASRSEATSLALIVDENGRLLFTDDAGRCLLAADKGIALRDGRLELGTADAQAQLERAIATACGRRPERWGESSIAMPLDEMGARAAIEVMPCERPVYASDPFNSRPAALLRIYLPDGAPHSSVPALQVPGPAIGEQRNSERSSRLALIKQDIQENLAHPDLSLAWLARRHGITPRAMRNLFYAENSNFSSYLMNARLDHARAMLSDARHREKNVATIAFESGFGDISWFHQVFRRRFGTTPSELRNRG